MIEFESGIEEPDSIASAWELGVAVGKSRDPIRIWFLKFDRLGLGYKFSNSSEFRGIALMFNSKYDL